MTRRSGRSTAAVALDHLSTRVDGRRSPDRALAIAPRLPPAVEPESREILGRVEVVERVRRRHRAPLLLRHVDRPRRRRGAQRSDRSPPATSRGRGVERRALVAGATRLPPSVAHWHDDAVAGPRRRAARGARASTNGRSTPRRRAAPVVPAARELLAAGRERGQRTGAGRLLAHGAGARSRRARPRGRARTRAPGTRARGRRAVRRARRASPCPARAAGSRHPSAAGPQPSDRRYSSARGGRRDAAPRRGRHGSPASPPSVPTGRRTSVPVCFALLPGDHGTTCSCRRRRQAEDDVLRLQRLANVRANPAGHVARRPLRGGVGPGVVGARRRRRPHRSPAAPSTTGAAASLRAKYEQYRDARHAGADARDRGAPLGRLGVRRQLVP